MLILWIRGERERLHYCHSGQNGGMTICCEIRYHIKTD